MKASDKLFAEDGIENDDFYRELRRQNILQDPQFTAIIEEYKQKSKEFYESKKD